MKYLFAFLGFVFFLNCAPKKNLELEAKQQAVPVDFEIVHQSKFEVLGDHSFEVLKSQDEVDNLYKYLFASAKGFRQIPIPGYEENETLVAVSSTPKTKNDIEIKTVNMLDGKLNIEVTDVENKQYPINSRYKSLIIIKLLKKYDAKIINLITK
ncbi:hypothetical protein [Soonwooa sp.]|uniref:hypothetical protein n=1 Tax=Soonwooa sp. TaxID=1938592 RepID=UPI00260670B0|nr:hypothetical protein [Soonwooa sp.]